MPLHLNSCVWSNFLSGSYPQGVDATADSCWCQHELAICVAMWQWKFSYFLNAQCKENNSHLNEFLWCIDEFYFPGGLKPLRPSCNFNITVETGLRSSSTGKHSLLRSWQHHNITPGIQRCSPILADLCSLPGHLALVVYTHTQS